jgi:hypothetical protein
LSIDGEPFPFESSTELYTAWNIASLKHAPTDVSLAVQRAMVRVPEYGKLGGLIWECYVVHNSTFSDSKHLSSFTQPLRCATTREKLSWRRKPWKAERSLMDDHSQLQAIKVYARGYGLYRNGAGNQGMEMYPIGQDI